MDESRRVLGASSLEEREKKKLRTIFTEYQISRLELNFQQKKYLTCGERAELAKELGVTKQQVEEETNGNVQNNPSKITNDSNDLHH